MRFFYGFKVLFLVWFNREAAERVKAAVDSLQGALPAPSAAPPQPAPQPEAKPAPKPAAAAKPARSEALTLLAALQREARFVDLVQEPLDGYSDAQVGAAARDVLRDCQKVVQRMFDLKPVATEAEGSTIEVPAGFDAGRIRLTGNVTGDPPFRGTLVHHGWEASHVQLPEWSGSEAAARVIAPAEVELK